MLEDVTVTLLLKPVTGHAEVSYSLQKVMSGRAAMVYDHVDPAAVMRSSGTPVLSSSR